MAKKLTEIQKKEILEGFLEGKSFAALSKICGFTPSTITRVVKASLSEEEYLKLKEDRKRTRAFKKQKPENLSDSKKGSIEASDKKNLSLKTESQKKELLETSDSIVPSNIKNSSYSFEDSNELFTELSPLNVEPFPEEQKEVAIVPLNDQSLPEVVYMVIDKKTELESKPLREFSQWSFLSDEEKTRCAIALYSTHREAKRNCSHSQKVLKVPNSKVFLLSSSYLISKGITRIIMDQALIAI